MDALELLAAHGAESRFSGLGSRAGDDPVDDLGAGHRGQRLSRDPDGRFGIVDAGDLGAGLRARQQDLAATAAGVEHSQPRREPEPLDLTRLQRRQPVALLDASNPSHLFEKK
jgi:hypothetical protein